MAKSRDAFRTISEVSDWLDTPAHVLRFWESKFTQIKPVKRAGGRRYYRPDDMALLSGIKTLLHEQGMTIKGVQKLLREQGIRHVIEIGIAPPDQQDADGAATIDIAPTPVPVPEATPKAAPETEAETESERHEAPIPHIEPAAWDSDDPWPADPATPGLAPAPPTPEPTAPFKVAATAMPGAKTAGQGSEDQSTEPPPETLQETPPDTTHKEPDAPDSEPAVAAPSSSPAATPPPRREVSLPFVRARAEAAEPPTPAPEAEILAFAKTQRPPIPELPDPDAHRGHPGALSAVIWADAATIRANAARIIPLAARLKVVADRIGPGRDTGPVGRGN